MPCAAAGWTSTEAPHSCAHNHKAIPLWPISYFHKVVKAPICSSSSILPPVRNLTVAFIQSAAIQELIRSSSCWTDWLGSTVGGQRYSNKKAKTNNWTWKGLVLPPDRRQKQTERVSPRFLIKEMAEAIFFFPESQKPQIRKDPPSPTPVTCRTHRELLRVQNARWSWSRDWAHHLGQGQKSDSDELCLASFQLCALERELITSSKGPNLPPWASSITQHS